MADPTHEASEPPRRGRRALRVAGRAVLGLVLFVFLLIPLSFVALRFEAVRTLAAEKVNGALASSFRGRLEIASLHEFAPRRIRADVTVTDAAGRRVIEVRGARVSIDLVRLVLRALMDGGTPQTIVVEAVDVEHAELRLIDDGTGGPTIASAFEARTPGPPSTEPSPTVRIERIGLGHAWIHGKLGTNPLIDVELSRLSSVLVVDPVSVSLKVREAAINARLMPYSLHPKGQVTAELRLPLDDKKPALSATFHGLVADTRIEARGSLKGDDILAGATLPAVETKTLSRFSPDLVLRGPLAVSAHAEGTTSDLSFRVEAGGEPGALSLEGQLQPSEPLRLSAQLDAVDLDVSALVRDTPRTRVDAIGLFSLEVAEDRIQGRYELSLPKGTLAGEPLPALVTRGTLALAGPRLTIEGEALAQERGADAEATYRVETGERATKIEGNARVALEEPPRLVKMAGIRARGIVSARGRLKLPERNVALDADLRMTSVTRGDDRVGPTSASVNVEGPLDDPRMRAALDVKGVRAAGFEVTSVRAQVEGTAEAGRVRAVIVERQVEVTAESELRLGDGRVVLLSPNVVARDREGPVRVAAARVVVAGSDIDVSELVLSGPGRAEGSLRSRPTKTELNLAAHGLDLPRLARLARVRTPLRSGRASLTLRYLEEGGRREAALDGKVDEIAFTKARGGSTAFDLKLQGERISGSIEAELTRGARLKVDLEELALPRASDRELPLGRLKVVGRIDLTNVTPLIAAAPGSPIDHARGTIDLAIDYTRTKEHTLPELTAKVKSQGLALIEKRPAEPRVESTQEAIQTEPFTLRDLDFDVDVALDAKQRRVIAQGDLVDRRGRLLHFEGNSGPWPEATLSELAKRARTVPIDAHFEVPKRRLSSLPPLIRPRSMRGSVAGKLEVRGTPAAPEVVLDARATRLRVAGERLAGRRTPRLDVAVHAEYEKAGGRTELTVDHQGQGARALELDAEWTGDLLLAATAEGRQKLSLRAGAKIAKLDLETIPALKNRQIEGVLSGVVHVEHGPARRVAASNLAFSPLRIGRATFDRVNALAELTPETVRAVVNVDGQGGSLDARVDSRVSWPLGGVPVVAGATRAELAARKFRLAALWPLVSESVNELDGRLDAKLSATAERGRVELKGDGRVTKGVVQVPAVGQRFDEISATIAVDGPELLVRDIRARGLTGGLAGNARVEVDEALGLKRAQAKVTISEKQRIPVTVEGVAVGDAYGTVEAELTNDATRTAVVVKVPDFHLEVPNTERDGVQDLAADPRVRVGVHRADAQFVALPIQPLEEPEPPSKPLVVRIELGKSVWLRRENQLEVEVTGSLEATVTDRARMRGQIRLVSGNLDVSGKRFEIERGTVTFTGGPPSNPSVSALARWDAPVGYAVFADYAGTAENGKLTLRAEPPLTQDEILNLLLFGTPEGSVSSSGGDTAASAVGVAGGTAARGFNRAVSDLTNLDVQARIDTSTGSARPELMIPLTRRLSARVTRAIGEPAPGVSPDRTFLTLELRLQRHWALSALLGDRGASALDLIWRRHY